MKIQGLKANEVATMLFIKWGNRELNKTFLNIPDDFIADFIKSNFNEKWEHDRNSVIEDFGVIETNIITDTETVTINDNHNNSEITSESAVNANTWLDTEKHSTGISGETEKHIIRENKEVKINNQLKEQMFNNRNLCYTIAKDIAECLTLKIY